MKTFSDFFTSAEKWDGDKHMEKVYTNAGFHVGSFCNVCDMRPGAKYHPAYAVVPSAEVLKYIAENMIHIDNDRLYFEIILRSDGSTSVYVKYNLIIGSRNLGSVDPETMPKL